LASPPQRDSELSIWPLLRGNASARQEPAEAGGQRRPIPADRCALASLPIESWRQADVESFHNSRNRGRRDCRCACTGCSCSDAERWSSLLLSNAHFLRFSLPFRMEADGRRSRAVAGRLLRHGQQHRVRPYRVIPRIWGRLAGGGNRDPWLLLLVERVAFHHIRVPPTRLRRLRQMTDSSGRPGLDD
jgi:hypothetical protein